MITINKAVLHVFDCKSGISIFSQKELDLSDEVTSNYLEKHIRRILNDSSKNNGQFKSNSPMYDLVKQYISRNVDFLDVSYYIGDKLYEHISMSDKFDSADLLIADCNLDDIRYIAILFPLTKNAYTHFVNQRDEIIFNEMVLNKAILPSPSQKIDSFAIINCEDYSISFCDKRRFIDGHDCFVIPDYLLECTSEISSKEAVSAVSKIAEKVAGEYGMNPTVALSRAKTYLVENAEVSSRLSTEKIGEAIFTDEKAQKAFDDELNRQNLPGEVIINRSFAIKTGRNHKIKTDTGIEISFPSEYIENNNFIEIINNSDGTISIELKNIGKILNK